MTHLKVGIIGSGAIAKVHASCVQNYHQTQLAGMVCTNAERKKELKNEFSCPLYSTEEELLAQPLDAVVVCNESGKHGASIIKAAKAKKHILCEKPLEVTPQKIDTLLATVAAQGVTLGVVFQNRTHPEYLKFKKALKEGVIGTPLLAQTQINWYRPPSYYESNPWRGTLQWDGGAALMNQGIHTLDLLLDLLGDVDTVGGMIATKLHQIEGEDLAVAHLTFKNGVLGTLSGGTALYPGYPEQIALYGTQGRMIYEAGKIIEAPLESLITTATSTENNSNATAKIENESLHLNILSNFIEAVMEQKEPLVNGYSAKKSVVLINALYQASNTATIIKI